MRWEDRFVSVVYSGGHALFFERFVQSVEVNALVVVSPWIQTLDEQPIALSDILRAVERKEAPTTIIMRSPAKEPMNRDADLLFRECPYVSLYYNNDLHAKIYVCRCEPFGFALLGSANLSGRATKALEIGLMIEGKGAGMDIVQELETLGRDDLPGRAGTTLAKVAELRRFG